MPSNKIIGITEHLKSEDYGEIEKFIKNNNFNEINGVFKINYIYNNVKTHNKTIYASCSGEIFKHLIFLGRIHLKWGSYLDFEDYGLGRCIKCCGYGHSFKNEYYCTCSAGNHSSAVCRFKDFKKCTNCIYNNNTNKTNYNINHFAHDNVNCNVFNKLKRNKIIQTDDYFSRSTF